MLVRSHDRRIDQNVLDFRLACQNICHPRPHTLASSARETHLYRMPSAEFRGKIAPRTAGSGNPQHRFEEPAIV